MCGSFINSHLPHTRLGSNPSVVNMLSALAWRRGAFLKETPFWGEMQKCLAVQWARA